MNKKLFAVFSVILLFSLFLPSCKAEKVAAGNLKKSATVNTKPNDSVKKYNGQKLPFAYAELNNNKLKILLARNSKERMTGLMFTDYLPENQGMLFVYDTPQKMIFWMKNTKIPLDLVFLSPDLRVTEYIAGMKPGYGIKDDNRLPRYSSVYEAQYALELPSGSIKKLNIKPGDILKIPLSLLFTQ